MGSTEMWSLLVFLLINAMGLSYAQDGPGAYTPLTCEDAIKYHSFAVDVSFPSFANPGFTCNRN